MTTARTPSGPGDEEGVSVPADGWPWHKTRISIPIRLGEVVLFRAEVEGLHFEPPFLSTPPQDRLVPPAAAMDASGLPLARLASCPVGVDPPRCGYTDRHIILVDAVYRRSFVDTSGSLEAYLAGFSPKTLSTFKRKERKIAASCTAGPCLRVFTRPGEMAEFHRLARAISVNSVQERVFNDSLPADEAYVAQMVELASAGRLVGFLLYIEDQPAAFNYCPLGDDGVMVYDYSGYDQKFQKYSPGTVLQLKVIEHAFADPAIRAYDLHIGEGGHKDFFATGSVLCATVYFFRPTVRLLAIFGLKAGLRMMTASVSTVLKKLGLHTGVKKAIRSLLSTRA
jgi:hypothetical protein